MKPAIVALSALLLLVGPPLIFAQGRRGPSEALPNAAYDGRFTFARIRYDQAGDGGFGFRQDIKWAHDYPRGERHLTRIVTELSSIRARTQTSNVLALDDPELFKYPVAYLCEAGYWQPSEEEVAGLRNYLLKGGFIIFDDFSRNDWLNFEAQMRRVLPALRPMRLTTQDRIFDAFYRMEQLDYRHPIFNTFFHIKTLDGMTHPATPAAKAVYLGIYEDNDPSKRLQVIINFNNDIGDYMEWSGEGWYPVNLSNDAYKFATNYVVYGLTH